MDTSRIGCDGILGIPRRRTAGAQTITVNAEIVAYLSALSNVVSYLDHNATEMDEMLGWCENLARHLPRPAGWRERIIDTTLAAQGWADSIVRAWMNAANALPPQWGERNDRRA